MTRLCPHCGSQAIAQLGVAAFAATWQCKACCCLWDYDADDLAEQAESESDFYSYLLMELRIAFGQPTDYPAWLRAEERRFVHFWIVPLRLGHGKRRETGVR